MFIVYSCIVDQHDLRFVVLAAAVCLLASYTAFGLLQRARAARLRWLRATWGAAAAVVVGSGVWTTHFVAMLAYRTGLPVDYDAGLTVLSILLAIGLSGAGYFVVLWGGWSALGGAVIGLAIATMHFVGMSAMQVPATLHWDWSFVAASVVISVAGAALAFAMAARQDGVRLAAPGTLVLTIVGLHFTAMAALRLESDPTLFVIDALYAPEMMAIAVASVTLLIVALGLAGSLLDQHLAQRETREADRLRVHVAELEATKRELERRTAEVTAALEAVAASSQAKSQFLGNMSHELRTPLNAIIGFATQQVKEAYGPLGDPAYREHAKDILFAGEHLLALINDILDISQIDSAGFRLHEEEVDLVVLVEDAARLVRQQCTDAGLALDIGTGVEILPVLGDERRLRQVLLNLLSNAIKFTPPHGRIVLAAAYDGDGARVTVADTGIGMAPEHIPIAFERFGQVENGLTRRYEGAGLGLPLSRQLVEVHGGTLAIDSDVGRGTNVTMRLPAARVLVQAGARATAA